MAGVLTATRTSATERKCIWLPRDANTQGKYTAELSCIPPCTRGSCKSLMLKHKSCFCAAVHMCSLRDTRHAAQDVDLCSMRTLKKAKIFCLFSLLNIQSTQGWHINLWHQGLFLKPWILRHSLAYLPALRLRWKLQKQFATDVSGTTCIFLPNTKLIMDSQDAAPALSHQINDIMQRNITVKQSKMGRRLLVKVPCTVTLGEVVAFLFVSDNRTANSSDWCVQQSALKIQY